MWRITDTSITLSVMVEEAQGMCVKSFLNFLSLQICAYV